MQDHIVTKYYLIRRDNVKFLYKTYRCVPLNAIFNNYQFFPGHTDLIVDEAFFLQPAKGKIGE